MTRTHDIRADGPMRMPDKWHGVILGNTAGAATEWKAKVKEAVQRADSLATGAMPYGSKSRTAQASGRVLGKARATMQYTVPHDKKLVTKELEKLQKAVTVPRLQVRPLVSHNEDLNSPKQAWLAMNLP